MLGLTVLTENTRCYVKAQNRHAQLAQLTCRQFSSINRIKDILVLSKTKMTQTDL